jgi:hypothetical protein
MTSTTTKTKTDLKLTFNGRQVGFMYVEFETLEYDSCEENEDTQCHRTLDYIDTSDIADMCESKHPAWIDTEQIIFTCDNMFLTAETRNKSGEMLAIRMIPTRNIYDINIRRDNPKIDKHIHKMKHFSKTTIEDSK